MIEPQVSWIIPQEKFNESVLWLDNYKNILARKIQLQIFEIEYKKNKTRECTRVYSNTELFLLKYFFFSKLPTLSAKFYVKSHVLDRSWEY